MPVTTCDWHSEKIRWIAESTAKPFLEFDRRWAGWAAAWFGKYHIYLLSLNLRRFKFPSVMQSAFSTGLSLWCVILIAGLDYNPFPDFLNEAAVSCRVTQTSRGRPRQRDMIEDEWWQTMKLVALVPHPASLKVPEAAIHLQTSCRWRSEKTISLISSVETLLPWIERLLATINELGYWVWICERQMSEGRVKPAGLLSVIVALPTVRILTTWIHSIRILVWQLQYRQRAAALWDFILSWSMWWGL